jgi:calcium/calmodulin-dependent protein kinase I
MIAVSEFFQALCCSPVSPFEEPDSYDRASFKSAFELEEEVVLGEGGFAVVKLATSIKTGRKVAVKIAKRADIDHSRELALRREFQLLKNLNHPNIVKAIGLYEEDHQFYFVLEYMVGGELFERIVKKAQYSEKEARDAICCILQGVQYLHAHDIVHRDLKPENLLLVSDEDDSSLKIADFGLARIIEDTAMMNKVGTPEYWAPEVINSLPCGKPVDMWSIGVIAFVLLGGYPPFFNKDKKSMFANISSATFKFHSKRWSNISEDAKSFIRSLLLAESTQRLTATQALEHRWIRDRDELLRQNSLVENLEELRKYNAMRKFRGGIHAVRGVQKLFRMMKGAKIADLEASSNTEDITISVKSKSHSIKTEEEYSAESRRLKGHLIYSVVSEEKPVEYQSYGLLESK